MSLFCFIILIKFSLPDNNEEHIKSVSIDTINIYLSMKEFNERKKLSFDQWRDVAIS